MAQARSRKRWGIAWLAGMVVWVVALGAWAGEPPREPILRLETEMHTSPIKAISVDAANRYLVTGSNDKTVRVWDLSTGQLLKILRPPVAPGHDGKVSTVAISPDGRTVAVGGWTGWDWDQSSSIYFFDRISGQMVKRLSGLPETIQHLAYSPDGGTLVATLFGKHGIRLYRTTDYTLIGEDRDYGAGSFGAAFDSAGRLITTSFDGFVRLYDRQFLLLAKKKSARWDSAFTGKCLPRCQSYRRGI